VDQYTFHGRKSKILSKGINVFLYLILASIAFPWIQTKSSLLALVCIAIVAKIVVLFLTYAYTKTWQSIHTVANRVATTSSLTFYPIIYINTDLLPLVYLACAFSVLASMEEAILITTRPYDADCRGLFLFMD